LETHTCVKVGLHFSAMKQVKSENRNRIVDETLDDSLRLATTNTSIAKGTIVLDKPRLQASR